MLAARIEAVQSRKRKRKRADELRQQCREIDDLGDAIEASVRASSSWIPLVESLATVLQRCPAVPASHRSSLLATYAHHKSDIKVCAWIAAADGVLPELLSDGQDAQVAAMVHAFLSVPANAWALLPVTAIAPDRVVEFAAYATPTALRDVLRSTVHALRDAVAAGMAEGAARARAQALAAQLRGALAAPSSCAVLVDVSLQAALELGPARWATLGGLLAAAPGLGLELPTGSAAVSVALLRSVLTSDRRCFTLALVLRAVAELAPARPHRVAAARVLALTEAAVDVIRGASGAAQLSAPALLSAVPALRLPSAWACSEDGLSLPPDLHGPRCSALALLLAAGAQGSSTARDAARAVLRVCAESAEVALGGGAPSSGGAFRVAVRECLRCPGLSSAALAQAASARGAASRVLGEELAACARERLAEGLPLAPLTELVAAAAATAATAPQAAATTRRGGLAQAPPVALALDPRELLQVALALPVSGSAAELRSLLRLAALSGARERLARALTPRTLRALLRAGSRLVGEAAEGGALAGRAAAWALAADVLAAASVSTAVSLDVAEWAARAAAGAGVEAEAEAETGAAGEACGAPVAGRLAGAALAALRGQRSAGTVRCECGEMALAAGLVRAGGGGGGAGAGADEAYRGEEAAEGLVGATLARFWVVAPRERLAGVLGMLRPAGASCTVAGAGAVATGRRLLGAALLERVGGADADVARAPERWAVFAGAAHTLGTLLTPPSGWPRLTVYSGGLPRAPSEAWAQRLGAEVVEVLRAGPELLRAVRRLVRVCTMGGAGGEAGAGVGVGEGDRGRGGTVRGAQAVARPLLLFLRAVLAACIAQWHREASVAKAQLPGAGGADGAAAGAAGGAGEAETLGEANAGPTWLRDATVEVCEALLDLGLVPSESVELAASLPAPDQVAHLLEVWQRFAESSAASGELVAGEGVARTAQATVLAALRNPEQLGHLL